MALHLEPEAGAIGLSLADGGDKLKFTDYYKAKQKLAKGSYGTVFVAEHLTSKKDYAVKVIERSRLSAKDKDLVEREVSIMKDCRDVENVVKLVDFFVAPDTFYVVQVFAEGGEPTFLDSSRLTLWSLTSSSYCFVDVKTQGMSLKDWLT